MVKLYKTSLRQKQDLLSERSPHLQISLAPRIVYGGAVQGLRILIYLCVSLIWQGCGDPEARQKPWRHQDKRVQVETIETLQPVRPPKGNRFVGRLDSRPKSFNPFDESALVWLRLTLGSVYESLVSLKAPKYKEAPSYEMNLASSVEWVGNELHITLKEKITFSDGTLLNAGHVKASINHGRAKGSYFYRALQDIKWVQAVNDRKIKMGLKRMNGYVLTTLARLPIVKRGAKENALGPQGFIGTGPFVQTVHGPDAFKFKKRTGYWRSAPALDVLEFKVVLDGVEALRRLRAGELDWLPFLIPSHVPQELERKEISQSFRTIHGGHSTLDFAMVSHKQSEFADVRLRRALYWLVGREHLATLKSSYAQGAYGVFWPGGPGDSNMKNEVKDRGEEHARALLDEAGWRDEDGDGVRQRGAERLMITVLINDRPNPARDGIVSALRKNGFVVDLRESTNSAYLENIEKADFDVAFWQWSGFADREFGQLLQSGGQFNFTGFSSKKIDTLLRKMRHSKTPAERSAFSEEFARTFDELLPVVPLFKELELGLLHRRFSNVNEWDGFLDWRGIGVQSAK